MPVAAAWRSCKVSLLLGFLTLLTNFPGLVHANTPDSAPPLPAPSGPVVPVSSVAELNAAVASLTSNQTIVLAPGTYALSTTLWLNGALSNVTIRGASNNRNDVVLAGQGMATPSASVPFGIWTGGGVTGLTVANLTIRDIPQHALIFNAGTESPRVYNVRLLDVGEQFLKANPDGVGGGVDNGVVEYSVIEYSNVAPTSYTNGVDVHTGRNWIVRHNLFRRIRSQGSLAGPAVLMWNGSAGTIAEGNTFIDCHRDISFGLIDRTPNDHTGGVIRNNFIVRTAGISGDVGIGVMDSPGTKVLHNSIWLNGQYPNAIEYRFADTTGVVVANNLGDRGAAARDGATAASVTGNLWTATAAWFVNPAAGDLHLTPSATAAIDQAAAVADVLDDWDGALRPAIARDIGADERASAGVAGDLNGDGAADLLFRHASGQLHAWFMNGSVMSGNLGLSPVATSPAWAVAGLDDLDGDGKSDVVFQHETTGVVYAWLMNGTTMRGGAWLQPASTTRRLAATGDLDGDGHADLVWQASTGEVTAWLMDRTSSKGDGPLGPGFVGLDWRAAAMGDLDLDGRADVVWQNLATGSLVVWFMQGRVLKASATLAPATVDSAWRIRAIADFNRDGRPDIIWQHATDGRLYAWFMNVATFAGAAALTPSRVNPAWTVAGGK